MAAFDPNDPDMKYLAVDRKALMKEQTVPFDGKKMCWVPDEKEGFLAAEIQSTKGDEITVKTIEGNEVNSHPRTKYHVNIKIWILYVRKNVKAPLSARYMVHSVFLEPHSEERWHPANEPSKIRENWWHGQHDLPEWGFCVAQLEVPLQVYADLRKYYSKTRL